VLLHHRTSRSNRQLVLEGEFVIPDLPLDGKRQITVLGLQVLNWRLLWSGQLIVPVSLAFSRSSITPDLPPLQMSALAWDRSVPQTVRRRWVTRAINPTHFPLPKNSWYPDS
jgi:hypothetical protein